MSYRRRPRHARPPARPRGVLVAVAVLLVAGVVAAVVFTRGDHSTGRPGAAQGFAVPLAPQPETWPTLTNPASGLSYQIPPRQWSVRAQVGTVGQVNLAQGAERTAYTCGAPLERLLRGVLGSGSAPRTSPAAVAEAVAQAAATQYYGTGTTPPTLSVGAAQPVRRTTRSGATVPGALVVATAQQHADPCLASRGEVLVLVLRLADRDGVLVVNADIRGGPADPAPATDAELRRIVATARPTD
ncbi:MAG TPA: hypothetical protein VJX10_07655 [Pseudonocardiaceae bacterium]|nr:hypothetical protein [Pseudonocardiaceae bacterium]